jgi:aminoglycoside phosphotransferase (APT) family kinase protein
VERSAITPALVSRLVAEQFPHWAHLPVREVGHEGWDNRTFGLGETMSVRLPSADRYAAQVEKEHLWLPRLAPHLPAAIPEPLARGMPTRDFPRPWSVYRWLAGEPATVALVDDLARFAEEVAGFLEALQRIDAGEGPAAGAHSFYRGGSLATYDADTRETVARLGDAIDDRAVLAVWEEALASRWEDPPVWVHGDVAPSNLLVLDGRLSAVIDFGCSAVGDPACDLAIAWTFFEGQSREAFRGRLGPDDGTWARGRGWALWKALLTLARPDVGDPMRASRRFGWRVGPREVIEEVLSGPR